jgi:hypothetical protein
VEPSRGQKKRASQDDMEENDRAGDKWEGKALEGGQGAVKKKSQMVEMHGGSMFHLGV